MFIMLGKLHKCELSKIVNSSSTDKILYSSLSGVFFLDENVIAVDVKVKYYRPVYTKEHYKKIMTAV